MYALTISNSYTQFIITIKGYLKNPEATSACLTEDGWLHSGDLGYYDEDLNLFIVDRLKELIKYKGFQVCLLYSRDL